MDDQMPDISKAIESKWEHLGQSKTLGTVEKVAELLEKERFRISSGR